MSNKGKIVLAMMVFSLITLAYSPSVSAADDNADTIQIPDGEEKTFWELSTDPYTRYLGGFFHMVWMMTIAGLAWIKSDSLGPPLIWIIVSSAALSGLPIPGTGTVFFALVAVFAVTVGVVRIVVKRERR